MIQKVWFTSGGVIFNFILAFFLFTSIIYIDGYSVIKEEPILGNVVENRPAALLGLQNGDMITKLDNLDISSWADLSEYIHSKPNTKISISWERNGIILSDSILVGSMISPHGDSLGIIGIEPMYDKKEATLFTSISKGFSQTISWLVIMSYSIFSFFTGQLGVENFGGPIQIASIAGEASQIGFIALINLMAILSVNLGIINILPFPGLDGGHALIAIIEGIIGRRIPFKTLMIIQQIGIFLLLIFFIIIMKNDISRLM
tara:strand:- start:338 stop:1117 length:780 start_codon:yes stop_codon:yes gene_type:complete